MMTIGGKLCHNAGEGLDRYLTMLRGGFPFSRGETEEILGAIREEHAKEVKEIREAGASLVKLANQACQARGAALAAVGTARTLKEARRLAEEALKDQ